jgi:hypothetical protein
MLQVLMFVEARMALLYEGVLIIFHVLYNLWHIYLSLFRAIFSLGKLKKKTFCAKSCEYYCHVYRVW